MNRRYTGPEAPEKAPHGDSWKDPDTGVVYIYLVGQGWRPSSLSPGPDYKCQHCCDSGQDYRRMGMPRPCPWCRKAAEPEPPAAWALDEAKGDVGLARQIEALHRAGGKTIAKLELRKAPPEWAGGGSSLNE